RADALADNPVTFALDLSAATGARHSLTPGVARLRVALRTDVDVEAFGAVNVTVGANVFLGSDSATTAPTSSPSTGCTAAPPRWTSTARTGRTATSSTSAAGTRRT